MILRYISIIFCLLLPVSSAISQVSDNFSDGDFILNPTWTGSTTEFLITSEALQLNSSGTSESHLVTPNSLIDNITWQFDLTMDFNPSSSNQTFVYLVSDQADLQGNLNGYYVLIGGSTDEISLFRQDGSSTIKIIDGADGLVNSDPVNVSIRVTRNIAGVWTLYHNVAGAGEIAEGTITDLTYSSTSFFGFLADYTSTRATSFFFDNIEVFEKPLAIDTIIITSENELILTYNQDVDEISATNSTNYSIDNGITISSISKNGSSNSEVVISINESLVDNTYLISVDDVADLLSGVPISTPINQSFIYETLAIVNVITLSENLIRITFNQPVDKTVAETTGNYLINQSIGAPTSATRNDVDKKIVELVLPSSLMESVNYQVAISNLENESGNSLFNGTSSDFQFIIPLLAESASPISANEVNVIFNKDLDATTATEITNYDLATIGNPSMASLLNDSTVTLTFASDFTDGPAMLTINGVQDVSNSLTAVGLTADFSYLGLLVTDITSVTDNQLTIFFNQPIDSISARVTTNYVVNFGIGSPSESLYDKLNPDQVIITFPKLVNNKYELIVSDFKNSVLNATLANTPNDFQIVKATNPSDILISEILADPSPSVGLPASEFIEIFNTTSDFINLEGFQFSGVSLPDSTIGPNEYLILTNEANVPDFETFGKTVGVSSFITLTNSGRDLVIKDNLGNQIDSLTYDISWYQDDEKANGGYSLELINQTLNCSGSFNWIASNDPTGGTPGKVNSVLDNSPDIKAPIVAKVEVIENDSLLVFFNETVELDLITISDFSLTDNSILAFKTIDEGFGRVALKLGTPLVSEAFYTSTSVNLQDCSGNISESAVFEFYYDALPPEFVSVVIKSFDDISLIFSEQLSEGPAEIEANFVADNELGESSFTSLDETNKNRINLDFAEDFNPEITYNLTITNVSDTSGNTITPLIIPFQYEQTIDSVTVIASNLIDVYFTESIEATTGQSIANYNLEEINMPANALVDQKNPKIVHLAFNDAIRENSERSLFIENLKNSSGDFISTPEFVFTYDTRAPALDTVIAIDSTQVLITFTEPVNKTSSELVNNYDVNGDIVPDSIIRQGNISQVLAYFSEPFEKEVVQTLTVRNVADVYGNSTSSITNRRKEFVFDPLPPRIKEVVQISLDSIQLNFSESLDTLSALTNANYVLEGVTNPSSVVFANGSNSKVILILNTSLSPTTDQVITINDLKDQNGNTQTETITVTFNAFNPAISKVVFIDPSTLSLSFSKPMEMASAANTDSYQLSGSPSLESITSLNSKNFRLNFATPFVDFQEFEITFLADLLAENGTPLIETNVPVVFRDFFEQIEIINDNTLALQFEILMANPTPANFQIDGNMSQASAAVLDPEDASIIRLVFSEDIPENSPLKISWKDLRNDLMVPIPNGATDFNFDTTLPEISSVETVLFNQLLVNYSEKVEEASATAFNHYNLSATNPIGIEDTDLVSDSSVLITFRENLIDGLEYLLKIHRIEDLNTNIIADTTIVLNYTAPEIPMTGEILITELMADPNPSVGLPEIEYVEIYNASDKSFDLSVMAFADASTTIALPGYELAAGQYVILTGSSGEGLFNEETIALSGFPSLGNTGDSLSLITISNVLIDQVVYEPDWYNDTEKDNGGYSLERISLLSSCNVSANWTASDSPNGGTPGQQNSVFDNTPDSSVPVVNTFGFLADDIQIVFNEPMDTLSFTNDQFKIEPAVTFTEINPSEDRLSVTLSGEFLSGVTYIITINGVTDCSGNALSETDISVGKGETPELGDLIITEIMADPDPTQGQPIAEYLEIYNSSDKLLDLNGITIADRTGTSTLSVFTLAPKGYLILTSTNASALFPDNIQVMGVTSFPSLGNTGDSLQLINTENITLDVVDYEDDWYNDTEKDDGGYSLERISLLPACNIVENWTASTASSGGSPGAQNSVFDNTGDVTSPEIANFRFEENDLIITFSEPMDVTTYLAEGFSFSPSIIINELSAVIEENSVRVSADFASGIIYELTLNNITDCSGNLLNNNQLTFGKGRVPDFGDLIITEIMADPEPSRGLPVAEYLELHNPTDDLLSIEGLNLADGTSDTQLPFAILEPGKYLLLTPNSTVDLFDPSVNVVGVSGWLSLNNGGEKLTISSATSEIFSVEYSDDWYDDPLFEGGQSLEMIDVTNLCGEDNNWTISSAPQGGTPAAVNSVTASNPDLSGPELVNAFALDTRNIELIFDEKLIYEPSTLVVTISPELTVESISLSEGNLLQITTSEDIAVKTSYEVSVNGLTDCIGNTSQGNTKTFVVAEEGVAGDLLLNEILFNPRTGGQDFVEIFNASDKFINLKDWGFGNDDFIEEGIFRVITEQNLVISPGEYLAFTEDKNMLISEYIENEMDQIVEINDLPTLADAEGSIVIVSPSRVAFDLFEYNEDFHFSLLDDDEGVSLERLSLTLPTNNPQNWKSASSGAGFATPGKENSQKLVSGRINSTVSVSPKVFIPGTGSGSIQSFTTINYSLENGGKFANVSIYSTNGQLVQELANGELLSTEGFFRWDGLDANGSIAKVGYYIVIFELFDNNGNTNVIKETVVVGTQF